jgi:hypothetical protein
METIFDIIKNSLIGKTIRVKTYSKKITQERLRLVKSSKGTTDSQFKSGNTKFVHRKFEHKIIGYHEIFENMKIVDVDVIVRDTDDYYEYNSGFEIVAICENNYQVTLNPFLPLSEQY